VTLIILFASALEVIVSLVASTTPFVFLEVEAFCVLETWVDALEVGKDPSERSGGLTPCDS
jgi:hypothetical protein